MVEKIKAYIKHKRETKTGLAGLIVISLFMFALICVSILNFYYMRNEKENITLSGYMLLIFPVLISVYMIGKTKEFAPIIEKYFNYVVAVMLVPALLYGICVLMARKGYFNATERVVFSTLTLFFVCFIALYGQIKFYIQKRKKLKEKRKDDTNL